MTQWNWMDSCQCKSGVSTTLCQFLRLFDKLKTQPWHKNKTTEQFPTFSFKYSSLQLKNHLCWMVAFHLMRQGPKTVLFSVLLRAVNGGTNVKLQYPSIQTVHPLWFHLSSFCFALGRPERKWMFYGFAFDCNDWSRDSCFILSWLWELVLFWNKKKIKTLLQPA